MRVYQWISVLVFLNIVTVHSETFGDRPVGLSTRRRRSFGSFDSRLNYLSVRKYIFMKKHAVDDCSAEHDRHRRQTAKTEAKAIDYPVAMYPVANDVCVGI